MYHRLPSYDNSYGDCYCSYNAPDEPCWGDVGIIDEYELEDGDYSCIYGCEGHSCSSYYIPSKLIEDQDVKPIEVE